MKQQFDVPILFIVFNRPDTTAIVFQKIREMRPAKLFVAADGPRTSREGEKERCDAVRKLILSSIDWECDVQTKFSEVNLGCGKAESSAMLWFFETVGEGIVIEDDTLPDTTFFYYCKEMLSFYRNDESIRMIGGNNFQNGKKRGNGSYYFSNITHSWGYASWMRAWNDYDFPLVTFNEVKIKQLIERKFSKADERHYWMKIYHDMLAGIYDTWDFQFLFKMWENDAMCIIPNENLVTNIGFGNNATHTTSTEDPASNRPLRSITKIIHSNKKEPSLEADRYFFKKILLQDNKWERRFKRVLSALKLSK